VVARVVAHLLLRLCGGLVTAALLGVLLGLAALLVGPRIAGLQPLIVLTGSMEPTLRVGGLAFMRPLADAQPPESAPVLDPAWQPTSAIRAGDIITFRMHRDPTQTISHRVLAVIEDEQGRRFQTQGDASPRPDVLPVLPEQVVGTVVLSVPRLGYVADWLRHGPSYLVLVGIPTAVVVLGESFKIARDILRARAPRPSTARHEAFRQLSRLVRT
jgi:signal peptidase